MAGKVLEIPFSFGNLVSVTPGKGSSILLWFVDPTNSIRGVQVDLSDPNAPKLIPDSEITIKRRTEGQARRKRGALPPIAAGAPAGDTAVGKK